MTPLLALTLTILTPTTPLATINHAATTAPTTERTSTMATSYPTGSPPTFTTKGRGNPRGTTFQRIGLDASNPNPARHGYPSANNQNRITNSRPGGFTDTRTSR